LPLFRQRRVVVFDVLDQLLDLRVLRVDVSALVNARQKSALPVLRFLDRVTAGAHRNEPGQVLIFSAQPVRNP
jgi:hypothetical protein